MNKHPYYSVSLSTRAPQEALMSLYGRPRGGAPGIPMKTASYRPPDAFFWATRYENTPNTGLFMGYAYPQKLLELGKEVQEHKKPTLKALSPRVTHKCPPAVCYEPPSAPCG